MPDRTAIPHRLYLFVTGLLMGLADLVPGISGGTVAFVMGVYDEWIGALHRLLWGGLNVVMRRRGIHTQDDAAACVVLAIMGAGIMLSMFFLAPFWHRCLTRHPLYVNGFFFGLIALSCLSLARDTGRWGGRDVVTAAAGIFTMLTVLWVKPHAYGVTPLTLFVCGALAACAMVLPGISGSYVLVLTGHYGVFIKALAEREIMVLFYLFSGAVSGVVVFIHCLHHLMKTHRKAVTAFMTGLVLASLIKVWPWRSQAVSGGHPAAGLEPPHPHEPLWGVLATMSAGALLGTIVLHLSARQGADPAMDPPESPDNDHRWARETSRNTHQTKTIDVKAAHDLWLNKKAVFIDMRRREDYARKHIPGAVWWDRSLGHAPEIMMTHDRPCVLYCYKGISSKKMIEECFHDRDNVLSLDGGFEAWEANYARDLASGF